MRVSSNSHPALYLISTLRYREISEGTDHLMCLPSSDWSGVVEFIVTYFMLSGGAEALEYTFLGWGCDMLRSVLMGQSPHVV